MLEAAHKSRKYYGYCGAHCWWRCWLAARCMMGLRDCLRQTIRHAPHYSSQRSFCAPALVAVPSSLWAWFGALPCMEKASWSSELPNAVFRDVRQGVPGRHRGQLLGDSQICRGLTDDPMQSEDPSELVSHSCPHSSYSALHSLTAGLLAKSSDCLWNAPNGCSCCCSRTCSCWYSGYLEFLHVQICSRLESLYYLPPPFLSTQSEQRMAPWPPSVRLPADHEQIFNLSFASLGYAKLMEGRTGPSCFYMSNQSLSAPYWSDGLRSWCSPDFQRVHAIQRKRRWSVLPYWLIWVSGR